MSEFTKLLQAIEAGDERASDQLLPLVYTELRKLAQARMLLEYDRQTLQPTALVHEAYLRLVGGAEVEWENRGHFFAAAAEAMRRILIERARRRQTKRGSGEFQRVAWSEDLPISVDTNNDERERLINLDQALSRLEEYDAQKAALVKLRFFAGLSGREAAKSLGISSATADRHWSFAKAWLQREIEKQ